MILNTNRAHIEYKWHLSRENEMKRNEKRKKWKSTKNYVFLMQSI